MNVFEAAGENEVKHKLENTAMGWVRLKRMVGNGREYWGQVTELTDSPVLGIRGMC